MKTFKTVSMVLGLTGVILSSQVMAKSGNGDSYSGPTLSGDVISLSADRPIKNKEFTKVIKSCFMGNDKDSFLLKTITPFYVKNLKFDHEYTVYDHRSNYQVAEPTDYFQLTRNDRLVEETTGFDESKYPGAIFADSLSFFIRYKSITPLSVKDAWKKEIDELVTYITVAVTLGQSGTLRLEIKGEAHLTNNNPKFSKELEEVNKLLIARILLVKSLPQFKAKMLSVDLVNPITGDYLGSEYHLQDLTMTYDRNTPPYAPVLNATIGNKILKTQMTAPNAEFADCVVDQLGKI